jgi:hypothetical protein
MTENDKNKVWYQNEIFETPPILSNFFSLQFHVFQFNPLFLKNMQLGINLGAKRLNCAKEKLKNQIEN